jgi:beta-phosphoglucomutase family hydrolase
MRRIAAIFDWDGVIIDSAELHERSWDLLAGEEGRELPAGHFKRGFGKKNDVIIPEILGWTEHPEEVKRLGLRKEALYRSLLRERPLEPLPGSRALLEDLKRHAVACAVGSSTPRENLEIIFTMTGLRGFFEAVVSGEDVRNGKPDPEVFLKAGERLGIEPARCVVFEDALVGIEAARRAGMRCIAVATTNPVDALWQADLAVESLDEVSFETVAGFFPAQTQNS